MAQKNGVFADGVGGVHALACHGRKLEVMAALPLWITVATEVMDGKPPVSRKEQDGQSWCKLVQNGAKNEGFTAALPYSGARSRMGRSVRSATKVRQTSCVYSTWFLKKPPSQDAAHGLAIAPAMLLYGCGWERSEGLVKRPYSAFLRMCGEMRSK